MTVYTSHIVTLAGLNLTTHLTGTPDGAVTPSGTTGDSFTNTGQTYFVHLNASGANEKIVTFNEVACDFGTDHDSAHTTPVSTNMIYGPFPLSKFGTSVSVVYSGTGGVTDVKALVLECPVQA